MPGSNILQAISAVPKILYSGQLADTNDHTLYTVPANASCVIKHGVLCNNTGSAVTITGLSIIPSGGAVDGTHRLISGFSLAANDSLPLYDYLHNACLGPGDSIHLQVGTAAAVDVVITGVENT